MERLLKVSDISERYGCTAKTARKYLRQMFHYENPLAAPVWAFNEWEQSRERMPGNKPRMNIRKHNERTIVPRKRD